jgi:DNA-binding MarR family transcriptional regulator
LSDSELLVIWLCRGASRVQVELAAALGVSPAQMSGRVERLAQRGLVALNRPARDRRRQVCQTTDAGESLLKHAAGPLAQLAADLAERLTPDEQALVQTLCERLAQPAGNSPREHHDAPLVCQEAA